jgi:hypothetical protein
MRWLTVRAGVSRTKAKEAISQAKRLGLVEVRERRRTGATSPPSLVTIVDREWHAWLKRGARIGGRNTTPTDTRGFREDGTGTVQARTSDKMSKRGHTHSQGGPLACAPLNLRRAEVGRGAQ